ncbi:MAG: glycosyltransferase family 2 protein [Myxococcales bacterium]|nr:glycosyltransferase [Myxococcales bacterium]
MTAEPAPPQIAIVIPCFNEALTVRKVIEDFSRAVPDAMVYVFDNNSVDGTGEIARAAGARVIVSPIQGKGNVIRHMSRVVDADIYVLVDGDDTYSADAAPAMLERFHLDHLDMLVGTRLEGFEKGSFRAFHQFGNRLISGLVSILFRKRLTDVLSGYRILSRSFVDVVYLRRGGFEVETEMTLQALTKHLVVGEMPVQYSSRPEESPSKLNTWGDGWLIVKCIVLLFKDYRPLVFFLGLATLLAMGSLVVGSAPIRDYIETAYVLHVPRAILATGLAILSLTALTAGLILDTVVRLHEETVKFWKQQMDRRR